LCIFKQVELFNTGDVIRVIDDIAKMHDLQENHGGWVDDMALVGNASTNTAMLCFVIVQSITSLFSSCRDCFPLPVVQSLGQVGRIVRVFPTGDVRVVVNSKTWTFNPACLKPAPGESPPELPG
jgi:hypothetical protein